MEGVAAKIQGEINGLQSERAALLAKLEKIELALTKAQAAKVRLRRLLRLPTDLILLIERRSVDTGVLLQIVDMRVFALEYGI